MRRVALPIFLALTGVPLAANAQVSPGPAGEETGAPAPQPPVGEGAGAPPAALPPVESTPAAAAAAEAVRAGAPLPPPENLEARTLPIVEIHGYLRTRPELFHNFSLGWDAPGISIATYNGANLPWFRNPDNQATVCGPPQGMALPGMEGGPITPFQGQCENHTQTTANMRLRLNPEIHPTEFLTIHSQIDILDNLILGSTPEGYYAPGGFFAPITAFTGTEIQPIFGYNAIGTSIAVKRAWAEVTNQTLGQLRFGRMPSHWGLGIFQNAGNGLDSDYQTTLDRIMYTARIRPLGIFLAGMWDFVSTGASSQNRIFEAGQGQQYDLSYFDDVHQWSVAVGRRLEPEQQRAALARGELVINGGAYLTYRTQYLTGEGFRPPGIDPIQVGTQNAAGMVSYGGTDYGPSLVRRGANIFAADLWGQLLGRNFRVEVEGVYTYGTMNTIATAGRPPDGDFVVSNFVGAIEGEYRLLNDRLSIEFRAGFATGDPEMEGLNYFHDLAQAGGNRFYTLGRFNPNYRVDLILWRQIFRQISGAYYFRPSLQYNFIQEPGGDLLSARADVIWSRASEFIQTRGNQADLGVEIDATLQYQTNFRREAQDPRPLPGFYALLQYGVFFPMGGLGPTEVERSPGGSLANFNFQTAQTVRGVLGVAF
jgi:uncharacterized protein (TIGR04551 family)